MKLSMEEVFYLFGVPLHIVLGNADINVVHDLDGLPAHEHHADSLGDAERIAE